MNGGFSRVVEIERKFLVVYFPVTGHDRLVEFIRQGYLLTADKAQSVRVRQSENGFWLIVKRGSGLKREEMIELITEAQFRELWPWTEGRRIQKLRHYIRLSDTLVAELDSFCGNLDGLQVVEVEFSTIDEAETFVPPDWFGREVTDDPAYTNEALARDGVPV